MLNPDSSAHDCLREFVDIEFTVTGLTDATKVGTFSSLLQSVDALTNISIIGEKVSFSYEPTSIVRAEIIQIVRKAGFEIHSTNAASSSPLVDALLQSVVQYRSQSATTNHSNGQQSHTSKTIRKV